MEACPDFKNRYSFCNLETEYFFSNYAVEVNSDCWNLNTSYSKGVYDIISYKYRLPPCDSIFYQENYKAHLSEYKKLMALFRTKDTSNIVVIPDSKFTSLITMVNEGQDRDYEFIGHQYKIYRMKIRYIFLGIIETTIVNFFPDDDDSEIIKKVKVPRFQILSISNIEPIQLNIEYCDSD